LSCGQHSEWRDGLCSECDCAERNAAKADEHDVDSLLREASPHRWVPAHYSADGVVTRKCVRCLASRIEHPFASVEYVLLGGELVTVEPGCPGIPGASERPYRCESCGGVGRSEPLVLGGRVVRKERVCPTCEGRKTLTGHEALTLLVQSSLVNLRCFTTGFRPAYLEQAEQLRDERALNYWARVCAYIERTAPLHAWRCAQMAEVQS
jgi:hypothetical protein